MRTLAIFLLLTSFAFAAPTAVDSEHLGPMKLGLPAKAVVAAVGQPAKKTGWTMEGATGTWIQTWTWPARGLTAIMGAQSKGGALSVDRVWIDGKSTLATARGIRLGATRAQVVKAYGKDINEDESSPEQAVVGSIYGGLMLSFKSGKVVQIFLGAGAE